MLRVREGSVTTSIFEEDPSDKGAKIKFLMSSNPKA